MTKAELEAVVRDGVALDLRVVGMLTIAEEVDPALARQSFGRVQVHGVFRASTAVKVALSAKMA